MSSHWGNHIRLSVFGESHGPVVGAVVEGLPPGFHPDWDEVHRQMTRRSAAGQVWATARAEADEPQVLSGVRDGVLTGAPVMMEIRNGDARSHNYPPSMEVPRPGHADYTAHVRYHGAEDHRGGGHFSGRLTAPIVWAGALARQVLAQRGVTIGSHIRRIGPVEDLTWGNTTHLTAEELDKLGRMAFPTLGEEAGHRMIGEIRTAKQDGDSLGGIVETAVVGLPAGLGSPMFDGLENRLASLLFGIPAIKGLQFGDGFGLAALRGSQANDPYESVDGQVRTTTNHNGGILGGITTGMPVVFSVAVKPTASIYHPQQSINLTTGEAQTLVIEGRHDPCIVPRALPVVEAATAVCLLDLWLEHRGME